MAQKESLSDNILSQLEEMITNNLKPGDRIPPEKELAERYGVGRSTIRESIKMLSAKKLVVRRNEGTFVSDHVNQCLIDPLNLMINMEIGNVDDLLELRYILEKDAIRMAAERSTEEVVTELKKINWTMQEPGISPLELQKRDIAFHNEIARATGNIVLMELLNAIRLVIVNNLEDPNMPDEDREISEISHQKLIEAIAEHDPEKGQQAMEDYLEKVSV